MIIIEFDKGDFHLQHVELEWIPNLRGLKYYMYWWRWISFFVWMVFFSVWRIDMSSLGKRRNILLFI